MGKMQRRKGHNYEREKARELTELGFPAKRLLEYQEGFGVDISCPTLPFAIQCKVGKNPPWYQAVLEAEDSNLTKSKSCIPIAFVKKDVVGEFAIIKLKDFYNILKVLKDTNFIVS